jgi:hypothetical protein
MRLERATVEVERLRDHPRNRMQERLRRSVQFLTLRLGLFFLSFFGSRGKRDSERTSHLRTLINVADHLVPKEQGRRHMIQTRIGVDPR